MDQGEDFTCACPFEASVGETSGSGGIGERQTGDGNLGVGIAEEKSNRSQG